MLPSHEQQIGTIERERSHLEPDFSGAWRFEVDINKLQNFGIADSVQAHYSGHVSVFLVEFSRVMRGLDRDYESSESLFLWKWPSFMIASRCWPCP